MNPTSDPLRTYLKKILGVGALCAVVISGGPAMATTYDVPAATTTTESAVLSQADGLIKTGTGTLAISNAANTYSGETLIQQGILQVGGTYSTGTAVTSLGASSSPVTTPTGNLVTVSDGATLQFLKYNQMQFKQVKLNGSGMLDSSSKPYGAFYVDATGVTNQTRWANATSTSSVNPAVVLDADATIRVDGDGTAYQNTSPSTVIIGRTSLNGKTLTKTGKGRIAFENGSSVSLGAGTVHIAEGVIQTQAGYFVPSSTSETQNLIIDQGAFFRVANGASATPALSGLNVTLNGTLNVNARVGTSTADVTTFTNQSIAVLNGGSTGILTTGATVTYANTGLQAVTIGHATIDSTFDGVIMSDSGTLNIIKALASKLTLNGTNAYTGTTSVTGGTLLVNGTHTQGSGANAGAYTVAAGATLGGTGTIILSDTSGSGTSAAGIMVSGVLSPGSGGVGTLTVNGTNSARPALSFASTAAFSFDLGTGLTSDRLALVGAQANDVTFSSNVINFTDTTSGSLGYGQYVLFTTDLAGAAAGLTVDGTGLITAGLSIGTGLESYTLKTLKAVGNTIVLELTAPPSKPVITSATTASGVAGSSFTYTITATQAPDSFNAIGLPSGLSVDTATGIISGTPAAAGSSSVTLSATNALGTSDPVTLDLTIAPAAATLPVITSSLTASGTAGSPFTYTITATQSPTSYSATGMPDGLSIDTGTGVISGTPSVAGDFNIAISAKNTIGTSEMATLVLHLAAPPSPVIGSATTASGVVGTPFTYAISATNNPTSYGASGLPAGLAIDSATGVISGTPTAAGTSSVSLGAANAGGTGTATLALTIEAQSFALSFDIRTAAGKKMAATDLAGVGLARVPNWNGYVVANGSNQTANLTLPVIDSSGAAVTGLTVTLGTGAAGNTHDRDAALTTPNDPQVFNSVMDKNDGTPATLTVTGIPYSTYDLYFYVYGDEASTNANDRGGRFTVGGITYYIRGGTASRVTAGDGTGYIQSTDTNAAVGLTTQLGNYVRFAGLTGDLSASFTALNMGASVQRLKVGGFQIVATTLPPAITTAPGAPTGVLAFAATGQVTVNWNPASTATSYTVKRSTSESGPFTTIATVAAADNGYTDTAVTNGTTYHYVVSAANVVGESANSTVAGATPIDPATLSAISVNLRAYNTYGMSVTDQAGVVRLGYWNNLLGPTVIGEVVSAATLTNHLGAVIPGATVTYAAGSTGGTYNGSGTLRLGSDTVTVGPVSNDPNLFSSAFDQYDGTASTITVTGIPYASYDLIVYVGDGGLTRGGTITANGSTFAIRGGVGNPDANGTGYVRSTDAVNTSGASVMQGNYVRFAGLSGNLNASCVATNVGDSTQRLRIAGFQIVGNDVFVAPTVVPVVPTDLTASGGNQQVALNWAQTPTATSYKIYRAGTSLATVSAPITSYADTAVTNGTSYSYTVSAVNVVGEGTPTATVSAIPSAPSFTPTERTVYQYSVPVTAPFSSNTVDPNRLAYLWVPPGCTQLKGVMVGLHNMLEKPMFDDPGIRQACAEANIGIVFISPGDAALWANNGVGNYTQVSRQTALDLNPENYSTIDTNPSTGVSFTSKTEQAAAELVVLLNRLATESGYSELQYAPILLTGHSAATPFVWSRGLHNTTSLSGRVIGILPYKGTWGSAPAGLPIMHVSSEWQEISNWGNTYGFDASSARSLRGSSANALVGECVQPGTGHYQYSEAQSAPLAAFIKGATAARVPSDWAGTSLPTLNTIDVSTGYLVDVTKTDSGNCVAVSYAEWVAAGKDPLRAYWYVDQATAQAVCDVQNAGFGKKGQMITVYNNISTSALPALATASAGYASITTTLLADKVTFQVRGASLSASPVVRTFHGGPLGIASGSIQFKSNGSGATKQVGPDTFRIWMDRGTVIKEGQPWEPFLIAYHDGDANYRRADRPAFVSTSAPVNNITGTAQTITFPEIDNQASDGLKNITMAATASSGLPVQYWVVSGPYRNDSSDSSILIPDTLPAKAVYPIKVIVGSWQWGIPNTTAAAPVVYQTFYVTAPQVPAVTSATTASGSVGQPFSYTITGTNTPTSYSVAGLPAGLRLDGATGIISGVPTTEGVSTITLTASNAFGSGTRPLELTIGSSPAGIPLITSPSTVEANVGAGFHFTIAATNTPTVYAAAGLPAGLSIDSATGIISGTPATEGVFTVIISATNGSGTGSQVLTMTSSVLAVPVISSSGAASGTTGAAFSYTVVASGSPTSYGATGLPAGLMIDATTGVISGMPTASGILSVNLSATNAVGTGTATLTITIHEPAPQAPVITGAASASGAVGVAFSYTITTTGTATSFAATGLPAGLTIDASTGIISGTPTTVGTSLVGLSASNAGGTATATLTLTISENVALVTVFGEAGTNGTTDAAGLAARFAFPVALTVDATGVIYIADTANHTIRRIGLDDTVTTLAGTAGSSGHDDGTGAVARFNAPSAIAADAAGNLYVADTGSHTIRKVVASSGVVTTLAGTAGSAGSVDGVGSVARFSSPEGIALDLGNLYVADTANHTIRKIVVASGEVSTLAGSAGESGVSNGTAGAARFNLPKGLAVDAAGNLYVADTANSAVRKILAVTGVVTTTAGSAGNTGTADGSGASARFNTPDALALDAAGRIYLVDTGSHTIRRLVPSTGAVTTLVGLPGTSGSADGIGDLARLNGPSGVSIDSTGDIYVADTDNHTVRILQVAPEIVTAPTTQYSSEGAPVSFVVVASGSPSPTYQWLKNGVALPGATSSTLTLGRLAGTEAGLYSVTATNVMGSVTSTAATLTVSANDKPATPASNSGGGGGANAPWVVVVTALLLACRKLFKQRRR